MSRQHLINLLNRVIDEVRASPDSDVRENGSPSGQSSGSDLTRTAPRPLLMPVTPTQGHHLFPRTPSSILAETRRCYLPYSSAGGSSRGRIVGRPTRRTEIPARSWTTTFCCLASRDEAVAPDAVRLVQLSAVKLGETSITLDYNGSTLHLENEIRGTFPLLGSQKFELMKNAGSSGRRRPLVPVCVSESSPSVPQIRAARVRVVFIRPLDEDLGDNVVGGPQSGIGEQTSMSSQNVLDIDLVGQSGIGEAASGSSHDIQNSLDQCEDLVDLFENQCGAVADDMISLEEFRKSIYDENPGRALVMARRDNFLVRMLALFKNPKFEFFKEPVVEFLGEPGSDEGAITKEFLWKGLASLYEERYENVPLFEGEMDHLIPSTDISLLQLQVFRYVGAFMAYSGIHGGISFIGLSKAVVQYIATECDPETIQLSINDLPDVELRQTIVQLQSWNGDVTMSRHQMDLLRSTAVCHDYFGDINQENARVVAEQLMMHEVIFKRKAQLDMMKNGFQGHRISDFIQRKPFLVEGVFPRRSDLRISAQGVLLKMKQRCSDAHYLLVTNFITSLDETKLESLIQAWIGWGFLTTENLIVRSDDSPYSQFSVQVCFQEMVIPERLTEEEVLINLNTLVDFGSAGFGQA